MSSQALAKHHDAFLHELLDYRMVQCPNDPLFIFSLPDAEKPMQLTFLEFGRAAHRVAHYIRPDPSEGEDNDPVAIIANIDSVVYHALTMGIMRAGYTVRLTSNTSAVVLHI
jgi:acyl-CoA synthetase (AMP-forming)/AMP-acid ligase II